MNQKQRKAKRIKANNHRKAAKTRRLRSSEFDRIWNAKMDQHYALHAERVARSNRQSERTLLGCVALLVLLVVAAIIDWVSK
jgi:hypothetical protein